LIALECDIIESIPGSQRSHNIGLTSSMNNSLFDVAILGAGLPPVPSGAGFRQAPRR